MPETAYAQCGDLSLAYQVFGVGDTDLVFAGSFVSHVELVWILPEAKAWFDRLGSFSRIVMYDKAGVGLSDPVPKVRSLEDRASEIEAVMDAVGFGRAVVMGVSDGGPASILFAATRPDRVKALILVDTFAYLPTSWDDLDRSPEEVSERLRGTMGEDYCLTGDQVARLQAFGRAVRSSWGTGQASRGVLPSVRSTQQLGMMERMSASPGMARATIEAVFSIDVRSVLQTIAVPTLIIHATEDAVPVQGGRYLADHIPGARLLEVAGRDHVPWFSDPDRISEAIEEFLTGTHAAPPQSQRALRTVLFSDIVGSTVRAAEMGDERWRALLERFDALTTRLADQFGGKVLKSTGDGHLATFDGPTPAILCALALQNEAEHLGIEIRGGIHTGECELIGDDIGGIAVHIAARIASQASPTEILVSSAVRDLVVGSGMGFEDRGVHELRGVPGEWRLLAVNPGGAPLGSPEAALISVPTPSVRSSMRRSDRVVAKIASRTPWLIRGLARLAPSGGRT